MIDKNETNSLKNWKEKRDILLSKLEHFFVDLSMIHLEENDTLNQKNKETRENLVKFINDVLFHDLLTLKFKTQLFHIKSSVLKIKPILFKFVYCVDEKSIRTFKEHCEAHLNVSRKQNIKRKFTKLDPKDIASFINTLFIPNNQPQEDQILNEQIQTLSGLIEKIENFPLFEIKRKDCFMQTAKKLQEAFKQEFENALILLKNDLTENLSYLQQITSDPYAFNLTKSHQLAKDTVLPFKDLKRQIRRLEKKIQETQKDLNAESITLAILEKAERTQLLARDTLQRYQHQYQQLHPQKKIRLCYKAKYQELKKLAQLFENKTCHLTSQNPFKKDLTHHFYLFNQAQESLRKHMRFFPKGCSVIQMSAEPKREDLCHHSDHHQYILTDEGLWYFHNKTKQLKKLQFLEDKSLSSLQTELQLAPNRGRVATQQDLDNITTYTGYIPLDLKNFQENSVNMPQWIKQFQEYFEKAQHTLALDQLQEMTENAEEAEKRFASKEYQVSEKILRKLKEEYNRIYKQYNNNIITHAISTEAPEKLNTQQRHEYEENLAEKLQKVDQRLVKLREYWHIFHQLNTSYTKKTLIESKASELFSVKQQRWRQHQLTYEFQLKQSIRDCFLNDNMEALSDGKRSELTQWIRKNIIKKIHYVFLLLGSKITKTDDIHRFRFFVTTGACATEKNIINLGRKSLDSLNQ